ncbi:hypothetical protein [Nonomuraea sp. NPDC048826]|uniref:hypothetical protein n=1 Tax=Nonomuraea sp. NPDC048826 TaxID=3364347 RepID=UPI00371D412D
MLSRRRFLTALPAAGLAAAGLAGCSGDRPLRVAVVWSGDELRRFLAVTRDYPRPVTVYSAGDNIAALLRGPSVEVSPDVAVIPRLGLLHDPAITGGIEPLADPPPQPEFWRELVSADGRVLGAWFKIAHKSLVWHRADDGPPPPRTLDAWTTHPGRLSVGAADGWMLSDWFENVLLARSPSTYRGLFSQAELWASGEVAQALELLAAIWQRGLTPERGRRALTLQFHDSILDVFTYRTADLVAAPDFAWPVIARYGAAGVTAAHARFPAVAGAAAPPLVVGGDVALALNAGRPGDPDAAAFVTWLTGPDRAAGRPDPLAAWAGEGGFLAPYLPPELSPPPLREPAGEVARGRNAQYDLSDRLIGPLAGGDGRGLWRVLTELFTAATVARERPAAAAAAAADRLAETARKGAR